MATRGKKETGSNLLNIGKVKLESDDLYAWGILVFGDKLVITDRKSEKVHVYRRHDGMLLSSSDRLESSPYGVCYVNDTDLCLAMNNGIRLISVSDSGLIYRGRTIQLQPSFDECYGVAGFRDNVVVSGVKDNTICWCVVSIQDGRHENFHKVCGGKWSWMTTKENMLYISCNAKYARDDIGVYGFNLMNPSQPPYTYKHKGLWLLGITVDDNGYLFMCDYFDSIHHLTEKCELVAIYTEGIPRHPEAIFWDSGILYVVAAESNEVIMYETPHQGTGIPLEILNMDDRSIQLFENALKGGREKIYNIRVMVVGHLGVGKTTLIKRLLGKDVNISERCSTEGIDVHLHCCDVSLSSSEWTLRKNDSELDYRLQRLAKVLNEKQSMKNEVVDEQHVAIHHEGERTHIGARYQVTEEQYHLSTQPDLIQDLPSTTRQQVGFPSSVMQRNLPKSDAHIMVRSGPGENVSSESPVKDPMMEMLQLLQKNVKKLKKDLGKYAPLTMWDFAGQYAFYTTHQMFLSRRAIYLLVSDISQNVNDLVEDECYFDRKGVIKCRVHELVEVWLNSIHSCAPPNMESITFDRKSDHVIPPPVILVGTHVDSISKAGKQEETKETTSQASKPVLSKMNPKVSTTKRTLEKSSQQRKPQPVQSVAPAFTRKGATASTVKDQTQVVAKELSDEPKTGDYRYEVCESYFREIRSHLTEKPTRFHLVEEDFAIDNTVVDSRLEDLKKKIVEVATRQPYWGEEIPASWLPLEQTLMNLRAKGLKVAPRSLLENMSQAGGVQISTDELDLFLRFQHEIGTILYFSTELLKEKIVLDPQWMVNALKSLITAEMFVLRHAPSVSAKWFEFKNGKLFPELIDALWTKDENEDLHDNKEHILRLMEQLNIIAKPKLYIEDSLEVKDVNYFLAPCMLREETPREVICPKPHPQMESSSVMCYVFTGKFLPAPIFHRLLAACVGHWPLATKNTETTQETQIFCGSGVFQLDDYHKLTLHFFDYIISMRVTRKGNKDKTPSSKLCIEVKEFVAKVLKKIIGYLGHSLKFEEFIQCPEYNGESVYTLIPVSLLKGKSEVRCDFHDNIIESNKFLKFWFEGQGSQGKRESKTGKLHRNVLNQCLSALVEDLDFKAVSMYIQEKEIFDPVTLCEITEQKTTPDKTRELIKRIQQRDHDTYEKFKECLVQAKQAFLKDMLEEKEARSRTAEKETNEDTEPTIRTPSTEVHRTSIPISPVLKDETTTSPIYKTSYAV